MKGNNKTQEGEKSKGTTNHGRWSRGSDGTLRYRGVCPFNRTVCKLVNVFIAVRARRERCEG